MTSYSGHRSPQPSLCGSSRLMALHELLSPEGCDLLARGCAALLLPPASLGPDARQELHLCCGMDTWTKHLASLSVPVVTLCRSHLGAPELPCHPSHDCLPQGAAQPGLLAPSWRQGEQGPAVLGRGDTSCGGPAPIRLWESLSKPRERVGMRLPQQLRAALLCQHTGRAEPRDLQRTARRAFGDCSAAHFTDKEAEVQRGLMPSLTPGPGELAGVLLARALPL